MNKNALAALVVILSSARAGAQQDCALRATDPDNYRAAQAAAAEQEACIFSQVRRSRDSSERYVAPRVLDATLSAMSDGPAASGSVMRILDVKKIDVYLASQSEPAKRGVVNGRAAILLSDELPPHPRVYAALIAAEAAKEMYADMPACAERSYMRMATAARAYAEMGGEFKALPVVDGDRVDAVKTAVGAWSLGAESALDALAQADGLPTIPDLRRTAADPEAAAALDAANARFAAFLMDESGARRDAVQR